MRKEILGLIIMCILFFVCFGVGYNRGKKAIDIQTDTVKVERVVKEYYPTPKNETKVSVQKIKIPFYAILSDQDDQRAIDSLKNIIDYLKLTTDSLEVELQRVQRYYKTDSYEAWVSGVEPALDSIKVNQKIQYVTNTYVDKGKIFDLNIGLNAGGWINPSYELSPNINVSYTIKRVTLIGEVGFQIPINNMPGTTPYWQFGLNYSLWSF